MDKSPALEKAYAAADRSNWSQVFSCLQEISAEESAPEALLELSLLALTDDDLENAWAIAKLLTAKAEQAGPILLTLLRNPNTTPEERWFGVQLIGNCPATMVVKELASCLETAQDPEMVEQAVYALVQFGLEAIEQLTPLLAIPERKMSALTALARIRHSHTIKPLLPISADPDPVAREIAVEALSSFHDHRIPPLLLEKLTDPAGAVRRAAVIGLGLRSDLASALPIVAQVGLLLEDPEPTVTIAAATTLGRMNQEESISALTKIQPDWASELGLQVLRSLGWLDRLGSIEALQKILAAQPLSETAIITAIRSLGQHQAYPDQASAVLIDLLNRLPPGLAIRPKQEIATALGNLRGSQLVGSLVQLMGDADAPVRWQAIYCLQQQGEETRSHLVKLSEDNNLSVDLKASLQQCLESWPQK
jgi:HEAT repeat protein